MDNDDARMHVDAASEEGSLVCVRMVTRAAYLYRSARRHQRSQKATGKDRGRSAEVPHKNTARVEATCLFQKLPRVDQAAAHVEVDWSFAVLESDFASRTHRERFEEVDTRPKDQFSIRVNRNVAIVARKEAA